MGGYVSVTIAGILYIIAFITLCQIHVNMITNAEKAENECIEEVHTTQIRSSKLLACNEHAKIGYIQCCILLMFNTIVLVVILVIDIATGDKNISAGVFIAFIIGFGAQAVLALWTIVHMCKLINKHSEILVLPRAVLSPTEYTIPVVANEHIKWMIEISATLLGSAIEDNLNALGLLWATAGAAFVLTIVSATSQEPVNTYVYALALASLSTAPPLIKSFLRYEGSIVRCKKAIAICAETPALLRYTLIMRSRNNSI